MRRRAVVQRTNLRSRRNRAARIEPTVYRAALASLRRHWSISILRKLCYRGSSALDEREQDVDRLHQIGRRRRLSSNLDQR
jgi:hypothetical protein